MNVKTLEKYPKLSATVQPILLTFLGLYMVKSGFSQVGYLLSKLI